MKIKPIYLSKLESGLPENRAFYSSNTRCSCLKNLNRRTPEWTELLSLCNFYCLSVWHERLIWLLTGTSRRCGASVGLEERKGLACVSRYSYAEPLNWPSHIYQSLECLTWVKAVFQYYYSTSNYKTLNNVCPIVFSYMFLNVLVLSFPRKKLLLAWKINWLWPYWLKALVLMASSCNTMTEILEKLQRRIVDPSVLQTSCNKKLKLCNLLSFSIFYFL